jgi:ABC-type phosphonate transport system ATPase subunit
VRYERLVIDAGDENTFALDFHPRLTVVTGVGRMEREGLMSELVGVLSSNRAGGALEVTDDRGRHLAIFRPQGKRHMVVDIDAGSDLSASYRNENGEIDLLGSEGLDQLTAKRRMRVTGTDLTTRTQSAELIRRLASCDQTALWKTADRVNITESELNRVAADAGTAPEDLEMVEAIEHRHAEFEAAQAGHEKVRRLTFLLAALCTVAAVPVAMFVNPIYALGALVPASAITAWSFIMYRRLEKAREAEQQALERVGATSYLGFHLQRVNTLLASEQTRRQLMNVAEAHRDAADAWMGLAGDVPVVWAYEHRDEIMSAARVRTRTEGTNAARGDDLATVLGEELVVRLSEARRLGSTGESFPLVLDDPFTGFDSSVKPALLELISDASHRQQILLLTEDPDVAAWARLESLTGALAVVEPSGAKAEGRTIDATDAANQVGRLAI